MRQFSHYNLLGLRYPSLFKYVIKNVSFQCVYLKVHISVGYTVSGLEYLTVEKKSQYVFTLIAQK